MKRATFDGEYAHLVPELFLELFLKLSIPIFFLSHAHKKIRTG
jgi:hypothetical protein